MTGLLDHRIRTLGVVILAIVTLGVFKSVYRHLVTPFRQLFLWLLSMVYAFMLSLTLLYVIAGQLQQIGQQFPELEPLLKSKNVGLGIFAVIFLVFLLSVVSVLGWYFEQRTIMERMEDGYGQLKSQSKQKWERIEQIFNSLLINSKKPAKKRGWWQFWS